MPKYYRGRDDVSHRSEDGSSCEVCGNRITWERHIRHAKYCSPVCYRKAKIEKQRAGYRKAKSEKQRADSAGAEMHNRSHFIGSLDPNAPHTVCGISVAASKKGLRAQLHPTNGVLIKCIEYMDADPASQNIPPSCHALPRGVLRGAARLGAWP